MASSLFLCVASVLVCQAFAHNYLAQYTEEQLDFFANVRVKDLPRYLQVIILKGKRTGDTQ